MTLPTRLRALAGIGEGDLVEAEFLRGKIVITPKVLIDRSKVPNAHDEYTAVQRRLIDAELAEGLADVEAGRVHGPFASAKDANKYIEKAARTQPSAEHTKHIAG